MTAERHDRTGLGRRLRIDVIFDVVCPWCFIGKRRLEKAIALRPHLSVDVYWWPFLLNPEMPRNGIDRRTYIIRKFGGEERARRTYAAVSDAGKSVGILFDFDAIKTMPHSVDAHRLIRYAEAHGVAGLHDSARMAEALFNGFFLQGKDLGRTEVLLEIAESQGFDVDETFRFLAGGADEDLVFDANTRAHQLGLNGVPSFVFNSSMIISGAQEPQVLSRMLDVADQLSSGPDGLSGGAASFQGSTAEPFDGGL
ncbi:MAG: DsbA family oxidoreductase [Magnetovibrionaceae bacterium]